MIVEFDKSFGRSIDKINNKSLLSRLRKTIVEIEYARSPSEIRNLKKPAGFQHYY
jgi:hypothetical protein